MEQTGVLFVLYHGLSDLLDPRINFYGLGRCSEGGEEVEYEKETLCSINSCDITKPRWIWGAYDSGHEVVNKFILDAFMTLKTYNTEW